MPRSPRRHSPTARRARPRSRSWPDPLGPEARGDRRDDQQRDDQDQPDDLQPDDRDSHDQPHDREVDPAHVIAPARRHIRDRSTRASSAGAAAMSAPPRARRRRDDERVLKQHPRGGAEQKGLKPRLLARTTWSGSRSAAQSRRRRTPKAPRRWRRPRQPRAPRDPVHREQAERGGQRRAQPSARQIAPVAAERRHRHEGQRDAGQRGMRRRVGDQRAPAQEQERAACPAANAEQAAPSATSAAL